jgi:hypothetical protein
VPIWTGVAKVANRKRLVPSQPAADELHRHPVLAAGRRYTLSVKRQLLPETAPVLAFEIAFDALNDPVVTSDARGLILYEPIRSRHRRRSINPRNPVRAAR